jgi:hypothetical protein
MTFSARHCLTLEENLCAKRLKVTNIVAVLSKLVGFFRPTRMRRRQTEGLFRDMEIFFTVSYITGTAKPIKQSGTLTNSDREKSH